MAKDEVAVIEQLALESELSLESDYGKKDLKEQRTNMKKTLYDGSKKLKHAVPKGKRI